LIMRLLVDDSSSVCRLGTKFGADLRSAGPLLLAARKLGLDVCGVSFHVGSGCSDPTAFARAVEDARKAFEIGMTLGHEMHILDIGGGFPGFDAPPATAFKAQHNFEKAAPSSGGHGYEHMPTFAKIAGLLRPALDKQFPAGSSVNGKPVQIIGEPGRFMVCASHTLLTNIIAKREVPSASDPSYMYYMNDGIYGSFNCLLYDHASVHPELAPAVRAVSKNKARAAVSAALTHLPLVAAAVQSRITTTEPVGLHRMSARGYSSTPMPALYKSSIWGPTCDGLDCVVASAQMPKLEVGEWLMFRNMGAYTAAAGSRFNGFKLPDKIFINS